MDAFLQRLTAFRLGLAITAVVAGPPLFLLYSRGNLDIYSALTKAGIVAAVCIVGAAVVLKIANGYRTAQHNEVTRARAETMAKALRELEATAEHQNAEGGTGPGAGGQGYGGQGGSGQSGTGQGGAAPAPAGPSPDPA